MLVFLPVPVWMGPSDHMVGASTLNSSGCRTQLHQLLKAFHTKYCRHLKHVCTCTSSVNCIHGNYVSKKTLPVDNTCVCIACRFTQKHWKNKPHNHKRKSKRCVAFRITQQKVNVKFLCCVLHFTPHMLKVCCATCPEKWNGIASSRELCCEK